jgi:hypothetical protein
VTQKRQLSEPLASSGQQWSDRDASAIEIVSANSWQRFFTRCCSEECDSQHSWPDATVRHRISSQDRLVASKVVELALLARTPAEAQPHRRAI